MGVLSKAQSAARAVPGSNEADIKRRGRLVGMSVTTNQAELEEVLDKFPLILQKKMLTASLREAAKIIEKETKNNLKQHRSKATGTDKKWSKKTAEKRAGREKDLHKAITRKVVNYDNSAVAIVGGRHPWAAHFHLIEFGGFNRVLWDSSKERVQAEPAKAYAPFRRAVESKNEEATSAMLKYLDNNWAKA